MYLILVVIACLNGSLLVLVIDELYRLLVDDFILVHLKYVTRNIVSPNSLHVFLMY